VVTLKKLFLCHSRENAEEVDVLASVLRLRGLSPWIDRQGGFRFGDGQVSEAQRAIHDDCFGLLLYATPQVFDSDFIRRVEIEAAIHAKDRDPRFVLAAVPRDLGFRQLSARSAEAFGVDLSNYASHALGSPNQQDDALVLDRVFKAVACDLMIDRLVEARSSNENDILQLQFSTRERLADEPGDVFCVDATDLFTDQGAISDDHWRQVHEGLIDLKRSIAETMGRPRLRVHGSKHLTAAFLLGYVFPSTAFELELRTKRDYWSTTCTPSTEVSLDVNCRGGSAGSGILHVELSTLDQPVQDAVRRYIQRTYASPLLSLRLTANRSVAGLVMTNTVACALAMQVRNEIARIVANNLVTEIHLFGTLPQALATMIGQRLNAFPPVQLYEYDGRDYQPSYLLQSRPT